MWPLDHMGPGGCWGEPVWVYSDAYSSGTARQKADLDFVTKKNRTEDDDIDDMLRTMEIPQA
jgi:hypothetical protein